MSTPTDVEQYEGNNLVQQYAGGVPEDLETGMDELGDSSYPRLRIAHKDARYVESVSDTEYDVLDCIILGFSWSRVMWKEKKPGQGFDSNERPQCRSNDNEHGQPNTDAEKPSLYPWRDSVFDPMKAQVNPTYNRVLLDCSKCNFQIWGSDGTRPACGLIMTVYVLYQPPGSDSSVTAFLSIKGAGIKPMKKFFQSIRQRGKDAAPYQFRVQLGLEQHSSGDVEFCTPTVSVHSVIEKEWWASLSDYYRQMRDFTKAIIIEADDKEISANGFAPPVSQDPNFFMSVNELKEGVDPAASTGGRRSAPPPKRVKELTGSNTDPLASLMSGGSQTIQGTVVQSAAQQQAVPQQPAQAQPAPSQTEPHQQPQAAPPPVTTSIPTGTPAQAQPVTANPPQQSAPVGVSSMMGAPSFGVPVMPQAQATPAPQAEASPGVRGMPWESSVPASPAGFTSPEVDSPTDEPEDDVTDEEFPFT